ncbi:MAG: hypothetical protein H6679_01780 [Epsilonproteobacteria bacterium]|nr:hypothetical protein [Campylobacterota bacterium]
MSLEKPVFLVKKVFFLVLFFSELAALDPLSRITVTSQRAVCSKRADSGGFLLCYTGNVVVTLANQTTITTSKLELEGSFKATSNSECRRVACIGNVCVKDESRTLYSNNLHFFPEQKKCELEGDVKIVRSKKEPNDIPVTLQAAYASYYLDSQQLELDGNDSRPVSTVIELSNHPSLAKYGSKKKRSKIRKKL